MRTGEVGEKTAEKFLKKKGYKTIEKNFRCKKGEIDLIMQEKNTIVFIEVKTRNSLKYGLPHESITPIKINHIKQTASWYLSVIKNCNESMEYRFDVVEILRINNKQYLKHTENAF